MIGGGLPLLRKNCRSRPIPFICAADFQSIFARSVSAVTPSKKVLLTRIGSPLRVSNEPKMNSVGL